MDTPPSDRSILAALPPWHASPQELFGGIGIGLAEWSRILAVFLLVEIEKALLRQYDIGRRPQRVAEGQLR